MAGAVVTPAEEAAALIAHYLRTLTRRSGLRWTAANEKDMGRLADLFDEGAGGETIPPFYAEEEEEEPDYPIMNDRVTQVFERDPVAAAAEEARQKTQQRRVEEADLRRLLRRES